jgi:hypothetical protein
VVFYIGAAVYAFGAMFFLVFGSGDVQPWANHSSSVALGDAEKLEITPLNKDASSRPDDNPEEVNA